MRLITHRYPVFVLLIACFFLPSACDQPKSKPHVSFLDKPPRLSPDLERRLHSHLNQYFDTIAGAYRDTNASGHAAATLALLRYSNRIPIYHLQTYQAQLERRIATDGSAPFLSFLIDYGYRLLAFGGSDSRRGYDQTVHAARKAPRSGDGHQSTFRSYIRANDGRGFWSSTDETAALVAALVFSSYGRTKSITGHRPEDFLRTLGYYASCKQFLAAQAVKESAPANWRNVRNAKRDPDACGALVSAIDATGAESASGAFSAGIERLLGQGILKSTRECLSNTSDATAVEMRERLEQSYTCHQRQDIRPQGTLAEGYDYWINTNRDIFSSPHVLSADWQQTTNDEGDEIEKYGVQYDDGSQKVLEVNHTDKTWSETTVDSRGRVKKYETGGPSGGGSYEASYNNGTLSKEVIVEQAGPTRTETTVEYDSNGNPISETTTETTENNDGTETVTTTTTDANGNQTTTSSTGQSTKQPPDEYGSSPCAEQLRDELTGHAGFGRHVTKLETQIIPAIDAPVRITEDPCFPQGGTHTPKRCASVWLCLEGNVDDNCRCRTTAGGGSVPRHSARCAQIICAEGATCDPETGGCRSRTGGFYEPGLAPANPPLSLGLLELNFASAITRIRLANSRLTHRPSRNR